ncbi:uncharacterized protein FTOL_13952 [Fusarium torulosum]|uniref:Uncharacterized protein n=1 Tax=Fusarium torulosum TaxID=33205 RepID=A0AAE8SQB8_9HYPO|nr:uncharacterized protein FTOL_13952 [Fusarium torulosum]
MAASLAKGLFNLRFLTDP